MDPAPGKVRRRAGPRRHSSEPRASGFTLVELLIALAMMGLITLLLFSALRIGSRAWDAVELAAERSGALRLARDFLGQVLSQARPVALMVDGTPVPVFAGDAERLELVSPLAERVGVPGLYILRLTLEDGGGRGRDLILTRWLIHPEVLEGTQGIPPWEPLRDQTGSAGSAGPADLDEAGGAYGRTRLLEGVDRFEIQYFGGTAGAIGEEEPRWQEDWLEQETPPSLVRIRLTVPGQSWPDLIVALPVQHP